MTSNVSLASATQSRMYLEWSVVGIGMVGGVAIVISGLGYGLTNAIGIGAGFFPLVAGAAIFLGCVLWAVQLLRDARMRRHIATDPAAGCSEAFTEWDADRVDPPTDTALGVLVVEGIDEEDDDIALPDRAGVRRVALVVVVLILGAIVLPVLGYLLTMTLMLFAVMTLVSARRWWVAFIVAVVSAVASRFVFETLLGTALPHAAIDFLRMMGL